MIAALLIWLFKKHGITPFFLVVLLVLPVNSHAQETLLNYSIQHNGKVIGTMQLTHKTIDEELFIKLSSQVQTRFVLEVNVNTIDQSHFKAGKLVSSSVYIKVNDKEKPCKKTKLINDTYKLLAGAKQQCLREPINYNMSLLYIQEPTQISTVYSDSFQRFLSIKKIASNKYRIDLPDGNYNEYAFKNGICNQVWVHHALYTIEMKLNSML